MEPLSSSTMGSVIQCATREGDELEDLIVIFETTDKYRSTTDFLELPFNWKKLREHI